MKITPIVKSLINYLKLFSEKYNYNHPNFYNREFDEAHQKINILESKILQKKIENQIHLEDLIIKHPFIDRIIDLKFKTSDTLKYRDLSIVIILNYLKEVYRATVIT